MRRLLIAAAAVATVAGATALTSPRAEAMTLPGVVSAPKAAEDVALICRRTWNGYRWVRTCYESGPSYYGGGGGYGYSGGGYAPRPYYEPRPRYYGGGGGY